MNSKKISFKNKQGEILAAKLEMPIDSKPYAFALFAHCFTCNKNLTAVRNISRALTLRGIAVLRFDFTGLGESEGDFADTDFSSNVADLVAAADFLEKNYMPPELLVGHSLGGAAVIFASKALPSVKAIATIGAPSNPNHVTHLFKHGIKEIEKTGKATLVIGGREFTIKKEFLDDLDSKNMETTLKSMRKALMIMHSPQDTIVGINNAAEIYKEAHHPKSFISLDGSDHLLSAKNDSLYVGDLISCWVSRYLELPEENILETDKQVVARLGNNGYTTEIKAGQYGFISDEPKSFGGNDFGPSPYKFISAGLIACTAITLKMYANRKKWDIDEIKIHHEHKKIDAEDCKGCDDKNNKIDRFESYIEIRGNLTEEQKARLLEIANKCPVHKTLMNNVSIITKLKD